MKSNPFFNLILFLFLLVGCNENEKEINLGNNFYYIPYQEIIFDVTTFGGNGIYQYKNKNKIPVVLPDIENYNFNSNFIIVKQKFNSEETNRIIENMLFMPNIYFTHDKKYIKLNESYLSKLEDSKNSISYEKFVLELLENSTEIQKIKKNKVNFFVINKSNSKIYGPFNNYEFKKFLKIHKINLDFE
jgi:hypothetical protein